MVNSRSFNPHPTRRSGATRNSARRFKRTKFQSSPDSKVGCNPCVDRPGRRGPLRFNPHPTRRSGATEPEPPEEEGGEGFNPHPTRRSGATLEADNFNFVHDVSILTRLEGRVQLGDWQFGNDKAMLFQSSPDSKVGCNRYYLRHNKRVTDVSILTRLEGRVQRRQAPTILRAIKFQSSPDSKVGCNLLPDLIRCQPLSFNPHPTRRSGATLADASKK